jgi:P-type conjugative transfer protein TrbJ
MKSKWLVKSATSIALVAIMAVETVCPAPAHAGVPGVFATEYTQILNYVELAGQLEKQVVMVENQLNQLADMAKHGITITDQLFGTVASDITTLRQIVNTGQALSYTLSNMDGTFRLRFPGYNTSTNYGQSYQTWSQTSLDSTLGALKAAGLQNSQFDSDSALLQSLKSQSQSAVGRMQAIEVGNQIAENQAEQLMKLRQLMMADMQSKAAYQSAMVQAGATKQANSDQFFGQTQVTSDGVTF